MSWELRAAVERPQLLPGLGATFAVLVLLGARGFWDITLHPLFQALVSAFNVSILGAHPFGFLADWFDAADTHVRKWIGSGIDSLGGVASQTWLWIASQALMVVVAIAAIAYELLAVTHLVRRRTAPEFVQTQVKPFQKPLQVAKAKATTLFDSRVPALERELSATRAQIKTLQHEIEALKSVALPVPLPFPKPLPEAKPVPQTRPAPQAIPRVKDLWDRLSGLGHKLGRLARLGTVAGLIGLVAGSLAHYGLGWLKCSKVNRTGKALCGMDEDLLQALLADALVIASTVSLVEMARQLETITADALSLTQKFWRAA